MTKIDLKTELKHLYTAPRRDAVLVDVPEMSFLMLDGEGDPNTSKEFEDAVGALYTVSYALKFMVKKEHAIDYVVMPLEGLWWTDDMSGFSLEDKNLWKWTLMIMQPEHVTKSLFDCALRRVEKKKSLPGLPKARFERFHEGLSAQIMHIGPYSDEAPTVQMLHSFIEQKGYRLRGRHHEIYLSNPRRSAPEKMKTLIRQPVG